MDAYFADVDELIRRFDAQDYLLDDGTATALFLALRLGRPLLLEGEPGVGKSALLEAATTAATDFQVLRARGIESGAELAFSGLRELLAPLAPMTGELPPEQQQILTSALEARGADSVDNCH
ncbi:MAG: hypothetical protein FWE39_18185, partial [Nocardiaceae bacterium]|nr:hypothetical protein [Nocardiaceae bacterium]